MKTRNHPPKNLTVSSEAYRHMWLTRAEQIHRSRFPTMQRTTWFAIDDEGFDPEPAGEEWNPYPSEVPDSSSPVLPGLKLAEFEHQVITALGDLTLMARDDPERFHAWSFQETIQTKMIKAVEKLEGELES